MQRKIYDQEQEAQANPAVYPVLGTKYVAPATEELRDVEAEFEVARRKWNRFEVAHKAAWMRAYRERNNIPDEESGADMLKRIRQGVTTLFS